MSIPRWIACNQQRHNEIIQNSFIRNGNVFSLLLHSSFFCWASFSINSKKKYIYIFFFSNFSLLIQTDKRNENWMKTSAKSEEQKKASRMCVSIIILCSKEYYFIIIIRVSLEHRREHYACLLGTAKDSIAWKWNTRINRSDPLAIWIDTCDAGIFFTHTLSWQLAGWGSRLFQDCFGWPTGRGEQKKS